MYLARCLVLWAICIYSLASPPAGAEDNQDKSRLKIMPLGDSITAGYSPRDSYRWPLWRLIQQGGFDVDFVGSVHPQFAPDNAFDDDHEGHWGFLTTQILGQLPGWLEANTPDVVLLHIGTNDVGSCRDPNETAKTTERIIDLIRDHNPDVIILLAKIIPIDFDGRCWRGESVHETVRQLNRRLEVISVDKPNVVLVDLHSALDAKTHLRDAAHPNEQGFALMAQGWFQALKPILVPSR
jgi:acyl-CoA thioesterase-1